MYLGPTRIFSPTPRINLPFDWKSSSSSSSQDDSVSTPVSASKLSVLHCHVNVWLLPGAPGLPRSGSVEPEPSRSNTEPFCTARGPAPPAIKATTGDLTTSTLMNVMDSEVPLTDPSKYEVSCMTCLPMPRQNGVVASVRRVALGASL